jgi:uncharacterized protein (TIGR02145 family)
MNIRKIILSIVTLTTLSTLVYGACTTEKNMNGKRIINVGEPVNDYDAATKYSVDKEIASNPPSGYQVMFPPNRLVWLDRNVGATRPPISWNDDNNETFGSLFQWGRPADGHEKRDSTSESECSTTDIPGHDRFITGVTSDGGNNWRTINADCLVDAKKIHFWDSPGTDYHNGVCPRGWWVPRQKDFTDLRVTSAENAFKKIKLNAAGFRDFNDDDIKKVGNTGRYWIADYNGTKSYNLSISSGTSSIRISDRAYGFSVRCVK